MDSIPESERATVFTALFAVVPAPAIRVRIDCARSEFELLGLSREPVEWPRELDVL
ncbi:hypothetical protein [Amycolatopsis japonica]|uniref:hypothetical protein n=1 Tax=Amycolatopsis japonica TaxID=208439 RepID=UPI0033C7043E